jgi:hopanoid biosynthesis associated protein HpnK
MTIYAILNADDFGLSPGINRGIIEAHSDGILTSASLMAAGDAFEEAVAFAHAFPSLSLGVHLTLVEGRSVLPPEKVPSLVTSDGRFCQSLGMFLLKWLIGQIRIKDVEQELAAQIEKTIDHKVRIDKLDTHMHVHLLPGIFQVVQALARLYGIKALRLPRERIVEWRNYPRLVGLWRRAALSSLAALRARQIAAAGLFHSDHFAGIAESGHLTEEDLLRLLRSLKPGLTEIMVHPGFGDSVLDGWSMSRRYQRERELMGLTSPRVKALVKRSQIKLVTYPEVLKEWMTPCSGDEYGQA